MNRNGIQSPSQARPSAPVALSIAGSDNSAGAGAQADLKTFGALGVYGLTAITCVVAEIPGKVSAIQAVAPQIVREQIRLSFEAFPVGAVKTGMLYSREIIEAVCEALLEIRSENVGGQRNRGAVSGEGEGFLPAASQMPPTALVVDPVMVATSGAALLGRDALEVYTTRLFKLATLVTPNLDEVAALLGRKVTDLPAMREAGKELSERFGTAFLIKGGHLPGEAIDLLCAQGTVIELRSPRVPNVKTHGTGCTLAAAIAAGLAKGDALEKAVAEAKEFVSRAIGQSLRWPRPSKDERGEGGTEALNHLLLGGNMGGSGDFLLSPATIKAS
jgi:hydroxymethylpyrimidine/phosphomethylpyrimidine kinase